MTRSIDGSVISTVNDRINSTYTVNLMSSVTAKKGIERVEEQLTRVKDMREKFSSFRAETYPRRIIHRSYFIKVSKSY